MHSVSNVANIMVLWGVNTLVNKRLSKNKLLRVVSQEAVDLTPLKQVQSQIHFVLIKIQ